MPIFHFDVTVGFRLEDPVGMDYANARDAKKAADMIARQIAADMPSEEERCVVVIDEAGSEIYKAPVKS